MTMVEKVARAVLNALKAQSGGSTLAKGEISDALLDGQFDLHPIARAAIEAMREPTQQMRDAVSFHASKYAAERQADGKWQVIDLHRSTPVGDRWSDPDAAHDKAARLGAADGICAMIDAALADEKATA